MLTASQTWIYSTRCHIHVNSVHGTSLCLEIVHCHKLGSYAVTANLLDKSPLGQHCHRIRLNAPFLRYEWSANLRRLRLFWWTTYSLPWISVTSRLELGDLTWLDEAVAIGSFCFRLFSSSSPSAVAKVYSPSGGQLQASSPGQPEWWTPQMAVVSKAVRKAICSYSDVARSTMSTTEGTYRCHRVVISTARCPHALSMPHWCYR